MGHGRLAADLPMHALDRFTRRCPRSLLAWLPVVVAHLALLAWMTARDPVPDTSPMPRQLPLTVWLLAPPPAAAAARPAAAQRPGRSGARAPTPAPASPAPDPGPATITAEPVPAAAITPPAPDAATPLDLRLPRGASTAGHQPLVTAPPRRLEDVVAQALGGSASWTEERVDNDTLRLRNGHRCVLLRRPHASAVDPMGTAGRSLPWQASTERPC